MNYQQTIDYLYHKLPMFSRMGSAAFRKDLTNIRLLCEHLGNPHQQFKSIHVAGTNGKGSVSHMLAAIFQASGYKTGLYTSPHLYDFRERIKLNGEVVTPEFVVAFVEKLKPLIEEVQPSFFEITVALAFQYFAEQQVDMAVVEVGLGGRLDSTNIISPELAIITNIGWDHMDMLGNTLEAIAGEKGGIIKENVPVVIGEALPQTKPVFQQLAQDKQAPLYFAEEWLTEEAHQLHTSYLSVRYKRKDAAVVTAETDLPGVYQVKNLRTVLAAVDVLQGLHWELKDSVVYDALKEVKRRTGLMGRWEVIREKPALVLEVAHNKNGIEQMREHLRQLSFNRLHIIFGMVKDKDADAILQLLPRTARYYFTQSHIPRALPAPLLREKAVGHGLHGDVFDDVNAAVEAALQHASADDLIIVCGSIFLVAEVKRP